MSNHDELDAVRELRQAVDRLPRELRPSRDLWPEIAGRLDEQPSEAFAAGWWRVAAAVVLVAGGLLTAVLLRSEAPARESFGATVAEKAAPPMVAARLRHRDGVLHAYNDLLGAVERRRGLLDDAGAATLANALVDLERSLADIEAALADHPGDRGLRLALAAAYRRESDWTSRLGRV